MTAQLWTIWRRSDRTVLHAAFATPRRGRHPRHSGWDWDAATQRCTRIAAAPDPQVQRWNGTRWVADLDAVKARLVGAVKAEAERRKCALLSAGSGKAAEHAAKRAEVLAWDELGRERVDALPPEARAFRFAQATADAAAFGDGLADAIARFRAGMVGSADTASVCAAEARTCAAIRAAGSVAGARLVAAVFLGE